MPKGKINVSVENIFPLIKKFLYSDHEIFERYHKFKIKSGFETKKRVNLNELKQLEIGDYVTHIDHGVGVFGGLKKIDVNGKIQEAIKLNIERLSIETGAGKFFEPARKLFKKCNFEPCEPFAHYKEDINSIYLTKLINNNP